MERTRNLVVRVADDELEMMHAIADIEREPVATIVRRWIRQQAEVRGIRPNPATKARMHQASKDLK